MVDLKDLAKKRSVSRAGTPFLIAKDISKLVKNNLDESMITLPSPLMFLEP